MFQANAKRRHRSDSKTLRTRAIGRRPLSRQVGMESLEPRMMLTAGTWTALAHFAPANVGITMDLLTDGTVMAQLALSSGGSSNVWNKLTPDATGSYVNGTWSPLANMSLGRSAFPSNILPDGRVFVLGGEYSGANHTRDNTNTGEIYNPVTNSWTSIANFPETNFGDGPTMLLEGGRVLAGGKYGADTYIYDPASNTWSGPAPKLFGDINDEEGWTKLPDGSVLSYDIWSNAQEAQRFDPTTMSWIDSGAVPVALQSTGSELGPGILLPDGRVFQIGATSNTALYTPSTTPGGTGTWAAGPVIPGGLGGNDAPAAMLPNGHVLFAAGGTPNYTGPTKIFEFDPTAPIDSSLTDVTPTTPDLSQVAVTSTSMLMLPSGQVLFKSYASNQLYVYTTSGSPQPAWKPTISSVVPNGSNYTLTGTQLNGLSAGASYGDDSEKDSNYPIIQLNSTDGSGHVYFARTFNWSSAGVATGSTPVSTDFSLAAWMPYGTYNLSVIANGIASDPVTFTGGIVGPSADLAVTNTGPSTSTEGSNVTYSLSVTNNGPTSATNVVLTDTLDANLKYASATKSQGSFTQSGSVVTFSFGTIAVGQTVTATVTAQATEDGNLTNFVSATSSLSDFNPYNNTAPATTVVAEPAIVVSAPKTVSGKNQSNVTVATFTHASGVEPASAFAATINWGDGSSSAGTVTLSGTTYTVKGSHTYAGGGSHTVTTTVVESGGSMNSAMFASASIATTPAAPTSSSSTTSTSASVTTAASASARALRGTSSLGSVAPSSAKVNGAGARRITDLDRIDALFELLNGFRF
jgi:uncharacterized repeat protein (TIGR01451 family)